MVTSSPQHHALNGNSKWQVMWTYHKFFSKPHAHTSSCRPNAAEVKLKVLLLSDNVLSLKVGLSPSKKICVICLIDSPLKMMKNAFYFILKALFILKIFKFLSRLFGHVRNSWRHNLVYKQSQYTYCPISQKVKATRQWNLVN